MDKQEREVLPGVFMVDFRNNANNDANAAQPTQQPSQKEEDSEMSDASLLAYQQEIGDSTCEDSPIRERIMEIENSIRHLIRSNLEMQEAFQHDNDPVYTESIHENIQIISKKKKELEKLKNQLIKSEGVML
eukprot:TRINITY_DN8021_c0_g2_i1.p1 TRINITY_DN8021_c0_g2~~TRINITY_DN8021_c0_g2_i1.p1  ORF type:complete len:132 (-),score=29.91 TRINITY_DN8021_c0_g2_i1:79-474(-)